MSNNNESSVIPHNFTNHNRFERQFDYFQMLQEGGNQQREALSRSIQSLQKPATSDRSPALSTPCNNISTKNKEKMKKHRWWHKALTFFKYCTPTKHHVSYDINSEDRDVHMARARVFRSNFASISGPLYMTDSSSAPTTPAHHYSQPLVAGLQSPRIMNDGGFSGSGCNSPYRSLRELNMEWQHFQRMSASASASPIYFAT